MKKIICAVFITLIVLVTSSSQAQFSAQNDAKYLATLKAVVNFKIDDEENRRDVEALRENQMFNRQLLKMMEKLSNDRSKDTDNQRVLKILERAGKEIYDILK